jgi:replication factor C small subunit
MFGDIKHDFLELNASDERGIDVVRTKIKDFARTRPIAGDFKIIFLDEADALTPEAQNALRRTMENYTQTCRFILSCNYSSKIIEPIQSRCAIFRFKTISGDAIKKRLKEILEKEKLKSTDSGLHAVVYLSEGDMRQAMNLLQSAAALGEVNEDNVYSTSSRARPEEIKNLIGLAIAGKFLDARNLLDKLILNYGMSGEDILLQMNKEVFNLEINDATKIRIIDLVGEANFTLVEGANERIQLEALLARIIMVK